MGDRDVARAPNQVGIGASGRAVGEFSRITTGTRAGWTLTRARRPRGSRLRYVTQTSKPICPQPEAHSLYVSRREWIAQGERVRSAAEEWKNSSARDLLSRRSQSGCYNSRADCPNGGANLRRLSSGSRESCNPRPGGGEIASRDADCNRPWCPGWRHLRAA